MSAFDYSKWDHIDLSDDEEDVHPNIDKESWFRLKHRTRIEREAKENEEKENLNKENEKDQKKLMKLSEKLNRVKNGTATGDEEFEDEDAIIAEMEEIADNIKRREDRLAEMEKNIKWNADNMCHVVEERTIISGSKDTLKVDDKIVKEKELEDKNDDDDDDEEDDDNKDTTSIDVTTTTTTTNEEEKKIKKKKKKKKELYAPANDRDTLIDYNDFALDNESILETYSEIESLEKTKDFIHQHGDILFHDHAQSYLLLSALEDEMNGKHERMRLVSRQSQIITHIFDLAKTLQRHPRDVVIPFFKRISTEPQAFQGFQEAVLTFIQRVQKRAVEKRREMMEEAGELPPREQRLGPGGLDPIEVLDNLPKQLREAFEEQNTEKLIAAFKSLSPQEAEKQMKLCVDSGLWVPNANSNTKEDEN